MTSKISTVSKRSKTTTPQRFCLTSFPSEGSHRIWPECLIRAKGKFGFEAKFGKEWFQCQVEHEGTKEECEKAQERLGKTNSTNNKQWSSAETELSDNEDTSIDSSSDDENEKKGNENINKKHSKNNKIKTNKRKSTVDSTDDEEIEILKDISVSINKKHIDHSNIDSSSSKKLKPDDTLPTEQLSSFNTVLPSTIVNQISDAIDEKLGDVKKMLKKVYGMQRRMSDGIQKGHTPPPSEEMIEKNVNLMSLPGSTASRFLLAAARVVLTDEQFNNGYLPDFRGDKTGRVPIPEESVATLKNAVQKRFGYKLSDMQNIWRTIRTSLVQKVSDVRKDNRKSEQAQQQRTSQHGSIRPTEEQNEAASIATVNQTEVGDDDVASF